MLVVISIIGILASITLPAIAKARAAARATQCASNLKDSGLALIGRSTSAPDEQFCTGNFDLVRDGVPTEIGWVSDLVARGSLPSEMMCPSNPSTCASAIEQTLTLDVANFVKNACFDRLGSPALVNEMGQTVANVSRQIVAGSLPPGSQARAELIDREMLQESYNTNYAASWFLVRGELVLDTSGNPSPVSSCSDLNPKNRGVTKGPLKLKVLGTCKAPTSTIPLLADASPAGFLSAQVGELQSGALYARAMVGGPIGNSLRIDTDADGIDDFNSPFYMASPSFANGHPRTGPTGWHKTWSHDTRQDYRGVGVFHNGAANVLMADGSVQRFYDNNGDGFINNGFDPPTTASTGLFWTSKDIEAGPLDLASYYSLYSKGDR